MRLQRYAPILFAALLGCGGGGETPSAAADSGPKVQPSILLVTLDTTRADAIGPESRSAQTPSFNALVARGRRFRYAYATTPQTLPSHSSMLTGLYPAGHGVHENGRYLSSSHPLLQEKLKASAYRTAAFVSAFAVARRFGLARGFDIYDDDFGPDRAERRAEATTDRAIAFFDQNRDKPSFAWVHYYDPHFPYEPIEKYRSRYASSPYHGEVAAMDEQLGRLVAAFEQKTRGPHVVLVTADHGEGLGDHGEAQHGNLLYQTTMHVPLIVIGPGVKGGSDDTPVSTRRIFHTILDFASLGDENSLLQPSKEVVVAEAMKPFLDYGWQPQVMAVEGTMKAIMAGRVEVYDVAADPAEKNDLGSAADLSRGVRATLREYPIPSPAAQKPPENVSEEERKKLASLGYVAAQSAPVVRKDAPRPIDMAHLFETLDRASALFVRERYAEAIPLIEKILAADPTNLDAALRLATAHSTLGHNREAVEAFRRAEAIAPQSADVRTYFALHYERTSEWEKAVPMLERITAEDPDRLPPLEALARVRERQGRAGEAAAIWERVFTKRDPRPAELARLGVLQMELGNTAAAIASFERARNADAAAFRHDLELGVLYLAANRLDESRAALDRVPASHPHYPMALFKRAQVSVLLREPDAPARIEAAKKRADRITGPLIARERLFSAPPRE